MFHRTTRGPTPGGADLRSLRLSLNTPVVAREGFPVGPAAAAVAVHGAPGAAQLLLALRAVRSGHVALLGPDSDAPIDDLRHAVDSALAFAESIGFLFEDELVGPDGDTAAARRAWTGFLAETAELVHAAEAPAPSDVLSKFRFAVAPQLPEPRGEAAWVRLLARY